MFKENCPFCISGKLSRRTKSETYTYKSFSIEVGQPGMYCDQCGESILNRSDLKSTRRKIHDLHAEGDGFLISSEVKRIRESLDLTQKAAGDIFGGGVNAFSRYERGEARQSKAIDQLLRVLDANPNILSTFHYDEDTAIEVKNEVNWVPVSSARGSSSIQVSGDSRMANYLDGAINLIGRSVSVECEQNKIAVNG